MAGVSYDVAVQALRERLGDRTFDHCERVARCARELARVYGVDEHVAELAGLLHDWDKDLSTEEQVDAAIEAGLQVGPADELAPGLLHSRTGAYDLRRAFPDLPDEIVQAVERHTAGAVDMQPLDMVVYIADMIEPERHNPSADELRELVGRVSLDDLFGEAYRHSILYLVRRRKAVHPRSLEVWNAHVSRWQG